MSDRLERLIGRAKGRNFFDELGERPFAAPIKPTEQNSIRGDAFDKRAWSYLADQLGAPSTVLVPPATAITRTAPDYRRLELWGRGAHDYYAACRTGAGLEPVGDAGTLPVGRGANVDWIPVA